MTTKGSSILYKIRLQVLDLRLWIDRSMYHQVVIHRRLCFPECTHSKGISSIVLRYIGAMTLHRPFNKAKSRLAIVSIVHYPDLYEKSISQVSIFSTFKIFATASKDTRNKLINICRMKSRNIYYYQRYFAISSDKC